LHEYETLPLKQREEHGLKEFDNRMLGRICWSQRDEIIGVWRNYIMSSFYIFPSQILELSNKGGGVKL
jgi:hypothetical protein